MPDRKAIYFVSNVGNFLVQDFWSPHSHQQLVVEKGLPPSRLQVAEASRLKYSGLSSGQRSSIEARTKSNLIQDYTPFKGGHKSFQEKEDNVNDSVFSQGGDWTASTPDKLHLMRSP